MLRHHWLAFWLVGLALLMRIVVPAGYMPMFSGNAVTVALCSGYGPMKMAMPDMAGHHGKESERGKGETPCGFAGLTTPSLAGADPILLGLAIAFIISTIFLAASHGPVARPIYLRPPPRGPPILS